MKIVFLTNLVNHHQIHVADELYELTEHNYTYVAFEPLPDWLRKGGYQEIERPYVLKAYESEANYAEALRLANEADVVMIGSAPESLVQQRLQENKVTFHYSERWFKDGYHHRLSPRAWKHYYNYHTRYRNSRSYMLCASAYTSSDVSKVFAYPNKCYKWGYFTAVPELDIDASLKERSASTVKILWIARFLQLKHPERMLQLGTFLKAKGYNFEINMIGGGELFEKIKSDIELAGLGDKVHLLGNMPNPEVVKRIREHHIFCFTSDRNEGWGAVLNEAMSNGCCPVASGAIGSTPFLVKDGENGFIYKDSSVQDLCEKVEYLINNPQERERMAKNAYRSMAEVWSPRNAAKNLLSLFESKLSNSPFNIKEGPCSKAEIIK